MTQPQGDATGPTKFGDQLSYWRNLKQQADEGTFSLDEGLAVDLKKHCETMLSELNNNLLHGANQLGYLTGFGTLPSSVALQAAFEAKATTAPDSLSAQYKKAIDIVTTMRDTYNIVITKLTASDHNSAAAISKQTGKL
ncbi:hypothetical protein KO481_23305 [Nocardia sp. NEAU-G5]|uniref:Uncharacterized protein n=1 Tax=Nocardia albiluteola TaxID=2842303 RepID=A0ABS6B2T7_9NOCA|nr:hypothetical protein [Nocardia albiluteola]MBU3064448.1 hypothetical protein [Nocardia albiluteola]